MTYPLNNGVKVFITAHLPTQKLVTNKVNLTPSCDVTKVDIFYLHPVYLFININKLDALNFIISLFQTSTSFEHTCSSSGGQKLYYTVFGIITPIGGRPVHGTATYRLMIPEAV